VPTIIKIGKEILTVSPTDDLPSDPMAQDPMNRLRRIMARLRDRETGCPWDVEQTFSTIAPYTIEEAYEVADAIEKNDMAELKEELGDLLLQVVFHAQMAEEAGHFNFDDVANAISDKMVRRHPHVFGDAELKAGAWEAHKEAERHGKTDQPPSALDGVALALPALLRAVKLQKRAARVGFDWSDARDILAKLREELGELADELTPDFEQNKAALIDEFGDVLFVYANLARHLDIDPEQALRGTNAKFERRFKEVEQRLIKQGKSAKNASLDEMEALWIAIKTEEKQKA
jgi:MazG family protein